MADEEEQDEEEEEEHDTQNEAEQRGRVARRRPEGQVVERVKLHGVYGHCASR